VPCSVPEGAMADGGRPRLVTPAFVALTLSELAYFTAIGSMLVVVPLFARDVLGVGSAAIGVAVGTFSLVALVLRPVAGRVADAWGRRRLLLLGAAFFAVTVAAHLLVADYRVLLLLRAVLGVAEAAYFVAGMAVLAEIAPRERLGEALSYNSLGLYLGITVGPALGEWLIGAGGFRAAWAGAAALGLLATLAALRVPGADAALPPEAGRSPRSLPPRLLGPGAAFVVGLGGAAGFLAFAALYAPRVGLDGAGGVLFVYGAVVVVSRVALGRFMDAFPAARLFAASLVLCAAGLALMGTLRSAGALVAGAVVLALGVTFLTPAFFRLLVERAGPRRGAAAAAFSMMVDLGLGGGPIVWGVVDRLASLGWAMALSAVAALVAAVLTAAAALRAAPAGTPPRHTGGQAGR
jgi:predicted MFS family arabinose efflux permease